MPVSHLSLTVSHIPSATSFFLSALQPLEYRYIGQRGDSIGLGVQGNADFYLTQASRGSRISPTHIAFSAGDRLSVRNCYAAAINAGGRPSGAPGYCDNEGTIFNAAIEDLDGNTIEFIFREGSEQQWDEQSRTIPVAPKATWIDEEVDPLDTRSVRPRRRSQASVDASSYAPRLARSHGPELRGARRAQTAPTSPSSEFPTKAIFGTILGAAAGAAMMWQMTKTERQNSREEAEFAAAVERNHAKRDLDHRSERRASANDALRSKRSAATNRRLKQTAFDRGDDILEIETRSRRLLPDRSQTLDAIEYKPEPEPSHRRRRSTRSYALIEDRPHYYIEAPPAPREKARSSVSSRHSTRRSSNDGEKRHLKRRDSVISARSHRSRHSHHHSKHLSDKRSSTSTIKPSHRSSTDRRTSVAERIPLPASAVTSRSQSYFSAAQIPIPESREGEWSGAPEENDESDGLDDMKTVAPDDSISCVDFSRQPSPPRSSDGSRTSRSRTMKLDGLRHESQSERIARLGAVAPPPRSRYSGMTLPVRTRERASRRDSGAVSYA